MIEYSQVLSFTRNSSNDVKVSLYTILRALSCSLFILSLICLSWNIYKSRQYLNSDSLRRYDKLRRNTYPPIILLPIEKTWMFKDPFYWEK